MAPIFMAPPRLEAFVGREEELRAIEHWLKADQVNALAIVGLGGIGKTATITEALHRHQLDSPLDVFWLNGRSDLVQQLSDAAVADHITSASTDMESGAREFVTRMIQEGSGVVVVDDVDRPNIIHEPILEGPSLAELGTRVAITSRFSSLPAARTEQLLIDTLAVDEAVRLLALKSGRDQILNPDNTGFAQAQALCKLLGCHPLAVVLAGGSLAAEPNRSLNQMISVLQTSVDLPEDDSGYSSARSIRHTLNRTYDAIPDTFTANLFNLLTALPADFPVTRSNLPFLAGGFDADCLARLEKALAWLESLAFVNIKDEGSIAIHPLVREFGRSLQAPSARERLTSSVATSASATVRTLMKVGELQEKEVLPRVFLCYARPGQVQVEDLHKTLLEDGFDPWMDKKSLLPGQDWKLEVRKAIHAADFFIACVSNSFVGRTYGHKEIRLALEAYDTMPEGTIYVIPARLENVPITDTRLASRHWVDLFEPDGYQALLVALRTKRHA